MTTSSFFHVPNRFADRRAWLPIICPACHLVAHAVPAGPEAMAVACEACGDYRLSCAGQRIFETQPASVDREQLSEAVQDSCLMAECDWPLIDGVAAAALVAMATLPGPAYAPPRPSGMEAAAR